jgi:predicted dinucleotide-binding enzyme
MKIGSTLTRRLSTLGHEVSVANSRGPETLEALAAETGARAVQAVEAARGADVLIVTIPQKSVPDLPDGILDGAGDDLVVVDTGNYYPRQRDGRIAEIEEGLPESVWVQGQLGVSVIKAFNGFRAQHLLELGKPKGSPGRIALPVVWDHAPAKEVIMRLVDELGFDAVDAGALEGSWRQQPGSPVYGQDFDAAGIAAALARATPERSEEWSAHG